MARVVVFFSTKGGVGKTLLATNLGVSLAQDQKQRVCLVDLDLKAVGSMSRALGLNPQNAMVDLVHFLKSNPGDFPKESFLIRHPKLGFDFLPAVLRPQQSPHLEPESIKGIFALLNEDYDYIVVDAGSNFSEVFVATLNQANLILLVVTPDIFSIYQTRWTLDTLQFLHFPLAMVKIILNRAESLSSISWQEVRVSLPCEIIEMIPSEGKAAGLALNRGIPVVIDSPRAKISQAIKKLSKQLTNKENLFIAHTEFKQLKIKETVLEQGGEFWQIRGLVEPLKEISINKEISDQMLLLKQRVHKQLIDKMDLKRLDLQVFNDPQKIKELKDKAEMTVANLLAEESKSFIESADARNRIVKEIIDEALGLGPLEDLLNDPAITDIMVNNKDEVYIERLGKIELTNKRFISNEQVRTIIDRIIAPMGRRIDESVPMVDARLPDGSRVNAIIPPLSLTGPSLTIRKFRKERFKVDELIGLGTINSAMSDFIQACVVTRKDIIVSGGTGSGKTTILNVLSEFIPTNERIVTIEDAAELKLHQEHWIRLESRPSNIEGKGAITIRDLFRNTLRMRPDRIIVGECRGVETLDMLQAMNTGHDGSMTTIHANSTHDVLTRIDSMILMSGIELPVRAIREMTASAVDLIVHTARLSDGTRKVLEITEIVGMKDETHIELRDIFVFKQTGIDNQGRVLGNFEATGYIPSFMDDIKIRGISLPDSTFKVP